MAAGVQAAGISDDRETERAYLNMEARCLATEKCDLQKGCCFIQGVVVLTDDSALVEDRSSRAAVQGNAFKAW